MDTREHYGTRCFKWIAAPTTNGLFPGDKLKSLDEKLLGFAQHPQQLQMLEPTKVSESAG